SQFGNVILFGLGGVFVELMKDVSFRIAPVNKSEALKMIKEIKSFKLLSGFRGEKEIDINKLQEIIVNISKLVEKNVHIEEIDFNPILINDRSVKIVDARIMVK
ncbi:acetate--CoA ligase family protein, partial [Nanoarchaeota archaeon]